MLQDLQVLKVRLDQQDQLVHKVPQDQLVLKVQLVQEDQQVELVLRVLLVQLDQLDPQDQLVVTAMRSNTHGWYYRHADLQAAVTPFEVPVVASLKEAAVV